MFMWFGLHHVVYYSTKPSIEYSNHLKVEEAVDQKTSR